MTSPYAEKVKPPTIEHEHPRLLGIVRAHCRDALVGLTPSRLVEAEERLVAVAYDIEQFGASAVLKHRRFGQDEARYLRSALAGPFGASLKDPLAAVKAEIAALVSQTVASVPAAKSVQTIAPAESPKLAAPVRVEAPSPPPPPRSPIYAWLDAHRRP